MSNAADPIVEPAPLRVPAHVPLAVLAIGGGLLWAYWPALAAMAGRWMRDPRYSHGLLVPPFALWVLWGRRARLSAAPARPSWWGLALIVVAAGLRFAGEYIYLDWLVAASLLPALAGSCLLVGGRTALGWAWPAIAFLIFMIPLPFRVEGALGWPLQRIATMTSTYALQTLGLPALAEGNVIAIDEARIGVVEACNGLGMLYTFLWIATAVAYVIDRPWPDRIVVILAAVPIAVVANVARITVTGLLHVTAGSRVADLVYHELAGWLMMPAALALLWAELWLFSRLFVEVDPAEARPIPLVGKLDVQAAPRGGRPRRRGRKWA